VSAVAQNETPAQLGGVAIGVGIGLRRSPAV
jgi:hypothetical protein